MLLIEGIGLFIEDLWMKNRSKETIIGYSRSLRDFASFIELHYNSAIYLGEISLFDLELYLKYQSKRGVQAVSINRNIYILRSFYNYLERQGLVFKNIFKLLEPISYRQKERVGLNKKELDALIDNIDHEIIKVVAITLANTGLRISELVNLKLGDVDLRKGIIYVIKGKGSKDRKIPINKKLKKVLRDYKNNIRDSDTDNFFATKKSGSISPQYVNKILKEASRDLGWEDLVTAHILRHSFASNLIREGVSVAVLQKLLGHADLRVTSRYIHQDMKDLKKAVEQL